MNVKLHGEIVGDGPPFVVLHGLFGSSQNWKPVARELSDLFSVHLLDLRNHGQSPRVASMGYGELALDVYEYLDSQNIEKAIVLGHNLGGVAAMALAVMAKRCVDKLIVIDFAQSHMAKNIRMIIDALNKLDLDKIHSWIDADQELQQIMPNSELRRFLIQNLVAKNNRFIWQLNLDAISKNIEEIIGYPEIIRERKFDRPTLFVSGRDQELSPQIRQVIANQFEKARFKILPRVNHWLPISTPETFLTEILSFSTADSNSNSLNSIELRT